MRYSDLFAKTKRDAPAEITDETLRLAYRAGLFRPTAPGQYLLPPLAANVISQMQLMLRPDLQQLGAQEIMGAPHFSLDLLASELQSYKHLPGRIYWYSVGMTHMHLISLEPGQDAATATRQAFEKLATDFFEYAGVQPSSALDVNGTAWYTTAPNLGFEVFTSDDGYSSTRSAATPLKAPAGSEALLPLQEIETPHSDTIEGLAQFLNVPTSRTAKAVFYSSGDRIIFAVIRGDLQIDESKVKRILAVDTLRWATNEEIASVGAVPGYASPVGTRGALIIVDDSITNSPNLVAGANKAGYHLLNTNVSRDYKPDYVADIALARAGDRAPVGGGTLSVLKGAGLGRISLPWSLDANYLDVNGKAQKQFAVSLELDLGAILLAHIASHRDDKGILWTRPLAPFDVHIVALNADKPEVAAALEQVEDAVTLAGLESFLDDRSESAGIKFNDADLLGMPLRITVGPKTIAQNGVEIKARNESDARIVLLQELYAELNKWMGL